MLLDKMSEGLTGEIVERALVEKGRRLPQHSLHRWWSRRFALLYRAILASYLTDSEELVLRSLENPKLMEPLARGKVLYEPFTGGGTGLIEASLMGYHSIGIDINPVAVRIARSTGSLLSGKVNADELERVGKAVLDRTEEKLEEAGWKWKIGKAVISYVFVTKGKVPSWIDKYSRNKTRVKILRCPHCGEIFESVGESEMETCPSCGEEFKVTHRPEFELKGQYPEQDGYRVWALEIRELKGNRWRKRVVDAREVKDWVEDSHKRAEEYAERAREILDSIRLEDLVEGRRLKREGIERFSQLFSTRQLATFVAFAEASSELGLEKSTLEILSVVLSESAKSASLVAKWHPPIGEPVPAVAMKTYWVPEYTVETNPLARVPHELTPLARNSLASALRKALRIARGELRISEGVELEARVGDARTFVPGRKVDLAIVDPPYMDTVRSYASLSIVHYGAMRIFDSVVGIKNGDDLRRVEEREIPRDRRGFGEAMEMVFSNINRVLRPGGRVVLFYNRKSPLDWGNILRASVESGLYPMRAYWVIGEPPGGLARSRLKGVFIVVMARDRPGKVEIVFKEPLRRAIERVSLDEGVEESALNALKRALERIYDGVPVKVV